MADRADGRDPAEHVVMVVVNDVVNDSRVLREATWLARAGLRVTVLGVANGDARDVVAVDRVLVARLPLSHEVSAARSQGLARRRAWRPLPAAVAGAEGRRVSAEVERLMRPGRELADQDAGRAARLVRRAGRVARRGVERVAEGLDGAAVGGWDSYDRWRSTDGRLLRWQSVVGGLVADYEATFGPVIDDLAPDVVHAHDVHVLGVAVHAARRAARRGRTLRVVYDAHEFVPGMAVAGRRTARSNGGWREFEQLYVRHADAVVSVGDGISDLVQEAHGLRERPTVVLNVPVPTPGEGGPGAGDVRSDCGLGPDVPLLVYSGTLSAVRGVDTAVAALAELPEAHLAVVCVPRAGGPLVEGLREQARALGCEDRLHLLPPVGPGDVVRYLAGADVGLITMHGGWPNHENAMPNKFFEYLRAGVPLVVTDLECLGTEVREGGLGATFPSRDAAGLAAAVRTVLADLPGVRARVASSPWRVEGDWRVQEVRLREVYERLLDRDLVGTHPVGTDEPATAEDLEATTTPQGRPLDLRPLSLDELPATGARPTEPLLLLGPNDRDGAARALAGAVRADLPDLRVEVTAINPAAPDQVDRVVKRTTYHRSLPWQLDGLRHLLQDATHVLVEDGGPLAGTATGPTALRELTYLTHLGVRCGVLLHEPPHDVLRPQLDVLVRGGVALLVSDPGLLGTVPGARWLPLVLPDEVAADGVPDRARRDGPPVVAAADDVARALLAGPLAAGLVRLHDGAVDDLGLPVAGADVDAVVLATRGVGSRAAVRTMAAGRLLVAGASGPGPWLPLSTTSGAGPWDRLRDDDATARAAAGPAWVREQHAGPASAAVLREALGLPR